MAETTVQESKGLLGRMIASRQLSSTDAELLARVNPLAQSEEEILRWLAAEYGLGYTTLEDVEPDRQLLSLFPARILLRRNSSRATRARHRRSRHQPPVRHAGARCLKTLTGLNLKPILASNRGHPARDQKTLGVGADTIGTLDEEKHPVLDENAEGNNLDDARRTRPPSSASSTRS